MIAILVTAESGRLIVLLKLLLVYHLLVVISASRLLVLYAIDGIKQITLLLLVKFDSRSRHTFPT